jgi:hypothetical protein
MVVNIRERPPSAEVEAGIAHWASTDGEIGVGGGRLICGVPGGGGGPLGGKAGAVVGPNVVEGVGASPASGYVGGACMLPTGNPADGGGGGTATDGGVTGEVRMGADGTTIEGGRDGGGGGGACSAPGATGPVYVGCGSPGMIKKRSPVGSMRGSCQLAHPDAPSAQSSATKVKTGTR